LGSDEDSFFNENVILKRILGEYLKSKAPELPSFGSRGHLAVGLRWLNDLFSFEFSIYTEEEEWLPSCLDFF
jgi:hypothetical protein